MATDLRAESATSPACGIESVTQVYESGDELVVLVRLKDGSLELRAPRRAAPTPRPSQHQIPGINPDATPC